MSTASIQIEPFFRKQAHEIAGLHECWQFLHDNGVRVAVEVGCGRGESSDIACRYVDHLYCVDPWHDEFECPPPVNMRQFDLRMSAVRNVTKIRKRSHEAADDFQGGMLDCVYIDGLHEAGPVASDINCWLPKIRRGMWIGGHDYTDDPLHAGVIESVDKILGKPHRRFQDGSWVVRV